MLNRRGEVGTTLNWIVATLLIIFILILTVTFVSLLGKGALTLNSPVEKTVGLVGMSSLDNFFSNNQNKAEDIFSDDEGTRKAIFEKLDLFFTEANNGQIALTTGKLFLKKTAVGFLFNGYVAPVAFFGGVDENKYYTTYHLLTGRSFEIKGVYP